MQNRSALYKKILTELDMKRTAAQRNMRLKRDEIYATVPQIEEIDRRISLLGIEAAKNTALNPSEEKEISERLKAETKKLTEQKNALLAANGFSPDCLKVKYSCELCSDTGFVDGKMCICFSQRLMDLAYNSSGIGAMCAEGQTFDSFDFSYYPPEAQERMHTMYNAAVKFSQSVPKSEQNLFFYGSPGLGKTHMCTAIALEAVKQGCAVMYVTAPKLFKEIEDERFRKSRDEVDEQSGYMQDIIDADLMIIDDLGTEFATSFTSSELFAILNNRLLEKKPVVISTNLSLGDIKERYGDRISSRIMGEYAIYRFVGDDIRKIKKYGI